MRRHAANMPTCTVAVMSRPARRSEDSATMASHRARNSLDIEIGSGVMFTLGVYASHPMDGSFPA